VILLKKEHIKLSYKFIQIFVVVLAIIDILQLSLTFMF